MARSGARPAARVRRRSRREGFDRVQQDAPTRSWTVLAQDPAILGPGGKALTTRVVVPAERLEAGPKGHRIHVIDFDAARDTYYTPRQSSLYDDPYEHVTDIDRLVREPHFHQQNVYAITMATLCEFQGALGRPVGWGFDSPAHQLKVAPHAFADANAYYSRESESLNFGYFTGRSGRTVFTCLSHDIVAHETAHALLDGLRRHFLRPSHVDQAAFHEGFADLVALFSVFKASEWIELGLTGLTRRGNLIRAADLDFDSLKNNVLFKLAKQFGREQSFVRADALRHSIDLDPSPVWLAHPSFQEPHTRGEILVAAMTRAFLEVWCRRLKRLGVDRNLPLNRAVVADEASTAAGQLLRVAIRALDYLPPVDMTFDDYLSALLTADMQLYPDDSRYSYRTTLRDCFAAFGITPANEGREDGAWDPPCEDVRFDYQGLHFESLQRDPNTLFRFIWENRETLGIDRDAFTRVTCVRPCTRVSNEGFVLRETVVEYVQTLRVFARELSDIGIKRPKGLSGQTFVPLYGGGTLIFDEFGRVKFHIGTGVRSSRQSQRIQSLYDRGAFNRDTEERAHFAGLHRLRMLRRAGYPEEQW
jgi:hypothetical protein